MVALAASTIASLLAVNAVGREIHRRAAARAREVADGAGAGVELGDGVGGRRRRGEAGTSTDGLAGHGAGLCPTQEEAVEGRAGRSPDQESCH